MKISEIALLIEDQMGDDALSVDKEKILSLVMQETKGQQNPEVMRKLIDDIYNNLYT